MATPAAAVKVIELRRRECAPSEHDDDAARGSPWHWQWVVSGHWQQLGHVPVLGRAGLAWHRVGCLSAMGE